MSKFFRVCMMGLASFVLVGMSFAIGYDPPPKSRNTPPLWWFFPNSSMN